jgi:hypothetical protein
MSQILQTLTFNLAAPIDATQTTIPVRNLRDSRGRAITAWPSALVVYATLEPRSSSNQEIISIAGLTNNGNGVVTFTGVVRNLDPLPPYATLGGSVPHANNAEGILSNNPPFYSNFLQSDQNVTITGLYQFPAPTLPASPATKAYADAIDTGAVHKTGNESVAGIKVFSSSPTVPTPAGATDAANKDYVDSTTVGISGDETVSGVKTFNSSPVVPTPVSDFQAATKKYIDDMAIAGAPNASISQKGISQLPTRAQVDAETSLGSTGARLVIPVDTPPRKFGGTGVDGSLVITSGTTNIDLAGAKVFAKNYTSISITGTGKLTFTNPHATGTFIFLKSQGDVTLTSSQTPMIDASGLGALGAPIVTGSSGSGAQGSNGDSLAFVKGPTGGSSGAGGAGAGGAAVAITQVDITKFFDTASYYPFKKYQNCFVGSGGGNSTYFTDGPESVTTGVGGRGGGSLVIECAGAWNFTTGNGISVAGGIATDANANGGNYCYCGGPGGGGGGYFEAIYNKLTANTGSVNVAGSVGGNGYRIGVAVTVYSSGGGAGYVAGTAGTVHSTSIYGGNGGAGLSRIYKNEEFQ